MSIEGKSKGSKLIREFRLSSFAVDNRTSIFVLTGLILFMGISAYNAMPRESYPEITQPTIYIGVQYPGNSPVDIENLVTRPIEKEVNTITGLKNVTSTSIEGYSTIIAEFNLDKDVDKALQEVKDAVDVAKQELPNDLDEDPNVFELNFSEFPIMFVNLYGEMDFETLRKYAEYLEDEIEKVDEISKVDKRGVLEREVVIEIDPVKREARQVAYTDIQSAIGKENLTMFGGNLLADGFRRNIRMEGEFKDPSEMEDIIVKYENNAPVYLGDIAKVNFGYVEPTSYARLNGEPVIILEVVKKSGSNLIKAAQEINEILADAEKNVLPKELNIIVTNDQSKQTQEMVDSLENNIISGVILVVLVLLFFLGLRNAAFVGVAIPLSMLMGIAILHFSGVTLNMMVLFSLILALGMLVDNGIVVVENVYRHLSEGKSNIRAAKEGVGEVAWPIIASTATTLAAFLPLIFWKSIMGEFMKYLPITLIIVLSSSLFVALIVNPVLTAAFMRLDKKGSRKRGARIFWITMGVSLVLSLAMYFGAKNNTMGSVFALVVIVSLLNRYILIPASRRFQEVFLPRLERFYHFVINWALRGLNPVLLLGGTFLLLIGSCAYFGASSPKTSLFPENYPLYVNVFIEMPIGTDIVETDKFAKRAEKRITTMLKETKADGVPYMDVVEAITAQVGEGTSDPNEGPSQGSSPNKARINVSFLEYQERKGMNTSEIMAAMGRSVADMPGAKITLAKDPAGPPVGYPINVEVIGEDIEGLITVADGLRMTMESFNIKGVEELKLDLETGKPQIMINVDRASARRYGLSSFDVIDHIQTALFGREISKYKEGEDDYPIVMRFSPEKQYDLEALMNQSIVFRDQSSGMTRSIPISAVADLEYSSTYGSVKRRDLERVITVFSNVEEGYNSTEIVAQMKEQLEGHTLPVGYSYKFTGEQEEQEESMAFLVTALFIAVGLIILIIVSQFNSVFVPLIILMTVVFSTIGVLVGITLTEMDFIVLMMMIGIISLAGIVVNNAIVLVDYINLLRERYREHHSIPDDEPLEHDAVVRTIVAAGETRLRPVLLTAITTVLGLIPLAVGVNINFFTLLSDFDPQFYLGGDSVVFWAPMAWTVIFGLTFATFLTLVIVPVMYFLIDRFKFRIGNLSKSMNESETVQGGGTISPVPAGKE